MKFISTRGGETVSGAEAIVKGIASDGGLFVPETFPKISDEEMEAMLGMDYAERAATVLFKFFDEFDREEMLQSMKEAYVRFGDDPAPLVRIDEGKYILELFHGPTCAFKDMALCILPYFLKKSSAILGIKEDVLVLTATSDTGKAALEGFKDREGVKIQVFYPEEGVSPMQKLFMTTQEGKNVSVVAVKGNFDDCQSAVKKIFTSGEYTTKIKEKGYLLSSANSINIGRLLPQIAYYFSAYCDLVTSEQIQTGEEADFTVPTGNFGNILAAYYAKKMGLPVGRLLCASNKNNVLTDFIRTGNYMRSAPSIKPCRPPWIFFFPRTLNGLSTSFRAGARSLRESEWIRSPKRGSTVFRRRSLKIFAPNSRRALRARTTRSNVFTNIFRTTVIPWIRTPEWR